MKDQIIKTQQFEHSIDSVWNAITKESEISTWFLKADFKAEVGYNYTFTAPPESNCEPIIGEIKSATPYELVYTWVIKGTETETTVSWKLESTETGTMLTLIHSGISNYQGDTAIKMFENFEGGWMNCLSGLTAYLKEEVHVG